MQLDGQAPTTLEDIIPLHIDRMSLSTGMPGDQSPIVFRRQTMFLEAATWPWLYDNQEILQELSEWDPSIEKTPHGMRPDQWEFKCSIERFKILNLLHYQSKRTRKPKTEFDSEM